MTTAISSSDSPQRNLAELLRQALDQAPDAILLADVAGVIRYWNRGAERLFGFSTAEALGASLDLIIPERLRERHWQGYHRVMAGAPSRYGDDLLAVPALHQNGQQLSSEFSIVLLRDAADAPCAIAAILRDVSARHAREKNLRRKLTELEQQRGATR
ncbi:MAG: PAS domain S-box protein [Desulfuromonas sp.]|uniref:PAS domain S-box protein n=1 Tax=Desulfuromonas thiophila TaxID=57664 RepID=UPI0024A8876A|nr:PAS domain S-box protein [Desulfuromonas thiophila]MCK9173231.1 PAS domain S-box protein [Desulfuromonas thiophila]